MQAISNNEKGHNLCNRLSALSGRGKRIQSCFTGRGHHKPDPLWGCAANPKIYFFFCNPVFVSRASLDSPAT